MFYCPLILLVAMVTMGVVRNPETPVAAGFFPQRANGGTKAPLRLKLTPASSCTADDPSVAFSDNLGLPAAHAHPWTDVRAAILHGQFNWANGLLQHAPRDANRWLWQGVLLLQERKTFASIRSLEQAAHTQDSCRTERLLAVDYLLLNQRILAADALGRAFQFDPRNALALYLRGRLNYISDAFLPAARDFGAFLTLEPGDYRGLYFLSLSEQRLGEGAAAQKQLRRSVDVLVCHHLSFWRAPYALAQMGLGNDEAGEAMHEISLALQMAHTDVTETRPTVLARILVLRGKIEERLGKSETAEGDWTRAVTLDPYLADGWYLLGRLYQKQGKISQAAHALKQFQGIQSEL